MTDLQEQIARVLLRLASKPAQWEAQTDGTRNAYLSDAGEVIAELLKSKLLIIGGKIRAVSDYDWIDQDEDFEEWTVWAEREDEEDDE